MHDIGYENARLKSELFMLRRELADLRRRCSEDEDAMREAVKGGNDNRLIELVEERS